ncbi:MAG: hypothetical protein FJ211_11105 [Ignavibacteria bacterium]|nr:hypothetical protein [Ignavibacteria bacterium]
MTNYVFRNGARVSGIDAQTAGDELARIQDHHGELTAPLVVDEARPDDAALHPAFEWDDEIAAELHRQHQARTLIRSVQIKQPDETVVPAYLHIQSACSYLPAAEVVRRINLYEDAYRSACARIAEAEHSLKQLERLANQQNRTHINEAIATLDSVCIALTQAQP